jgi:uncharacterized repeat protein (TIGR01451 family)
MKKHVIFIVLLCAMVLILCGSVSAADTPSANFTVNTTNGFAPLSVKFTDTSTGNPTSWRWDFGDGSTSTAQNPTHTYSAVGAYTVKLNVTNSAGSSNLTRKNYITAWNASNPMKSNNGITFYVANDAGVKYDMPNGVNQQGDYAAIYVPNSYYISRGGGGMNPIQLSTDPTNKVGQKTNTTSQSGTFWVVFSGGIGHLDDAILMLAVNGTIPDDFALHITSSGYTYDLAAPALSNPVTSTLTNVKWVEGAVNETFYKSDFIYGPQSWKPTNTANYPIYQGQDPSNNFSLMFIDLDVGAFCTNAYNGVTNGFGAYGWFSACNWGTGIPMASNIAQSGFNVIGVPSATFTANSTSGSAPLNVKFTDTSTNSPTSWSWNFGDGSTSTEQNPTHIYSKPGIYTVSLTAINAGGNNTVTQTAYITANDVTEPTVTVSPAGGIFNATQTVTLNATDDSDNPTIYYTTDGSDPKTSSTRSVYTAPIAINDTTILNYAAVDPTGNWSPVYNETYAIKSDVYVQITPSKINPQVGDKVTYTFKLGNEGPGIAKDVVFTYVIPEGVEFAGASVDQGTWQYDNATRTLTWNLGDVIVGDPNLWLDLQVLSAGNFNMQPSVSVSGYNPGLEDNIGYLLVNAVSAPINDGQGSGSGSGSGEGVTVNAAITTSTIPMQDTGLPLTGLISALLLVGSGLALSRKK